MSVGLNLMYQPEQVLLNFFHHENFSTYMYVCYVLGQVFCTPDCVIINRHVVTQ